MATWFNLGWLAEFSAWDDRTGSDPFSLFSATVYSAAGKRISSRYRAVSRSRVLARLGELGMFRCSEPHLFVRVEDPFDGDSWIALAGPQETDEAWIGQALERVKETVASAQG